MLFLAVDPHACLPRSGICLTTSSTRFVSRSASSYVGCRAALEQTLDRQCGARRQLGLVGSRGNLALVDQPHPSGSLPTRSPVSCDFAAPSNAACHRTVVHGAGCRGGSRAPWRVSVHRLSGRSWRSAAVSVFTHVTNGAGASIWRVTNLVLVLAGGGGCRTYCGACHWTVW